MLPFHSDLLATAAESLQWLAVGFVVAVVARQLGSREPYASSSGAFVMAIPTMRLLIGSAYVEPALCLCLAAALSFALHCLRRPAFGTFAFSAAGCALAAGVKVTMLGTVTTVLALLTLRSLMPPASIGRRLGWPISALLIVMVTLGPWMIGTYLRTGLPLTPLPVQIGGYTLGVAIPETEWYMAERPADYAGGTTNPLATVFAVTNAYNESLHALSIIPVVFALIGLLAMVRRSPIAALFMLVALALIVNDYFDPRLAIVRRYWATSSSRFLLPAFVIIAPLSVIWCREIRFASAIYLRLLWMITIILLLQMTTVGMSSAGIQAATSLAIVLFVLWLVGRWLMTRVSRGVRPAAASLLALVWLLALAGIRGDLRNELIQRDFFVHRLPKYWVKAAIDLDEPEVPRRIAVTAGPFQDADNWLVASFLGRELQNTVVYISPLRDGSIPHFGLPGHEPRIQTEGSVESWMTRLADERITHVMSFPPASAELRWMRERPADFRLVRGDADWGLFARLAQR
jgi:hypothetical protein